jgi:hypothetical protein
MPTPTYTAPPTVPTRGDPTTFSSRFAAWLNWMVVQYTELVTGTNWMADRAEEVADAASDIAAAALVAADAAGYVGRMSGSLALGAGTKAITLVAAKPNLAGVNRQVVIVLESDASIRMFGVIPASPTPTSTTFSVTVTTGGVFPSGGSGTYSGWKIIDAAFFAAAATAVEVWEGDTDAAPITPKAVRDSKAWVALTDAATVTPNGGLGRNFTWMIGGNRTLGAITNCGVNDTFLLEITQDGTGNRDLAYASGKYIRVGGAPSLSDSAGAKDYLQIRVISVDGSGTLTKGVITFLRGPSAA